MPWRLNYRDYISAGVFLHLVHFWAKVRTSARAVWWPRADQWNVHSLLKPTIKQHHVQTVWCFHKYESVTGNWGLVTERMMRQALRTWQTLVLYPVNANCGILFLRLSKATTKQHQIKHKIRWSHVRLSVMSHLFISRGSSSAKLAVNYWGWIFS